MSASSYRKLTGKRRTPIGYSQAWLGSDHLLVVNSTRFVEHYQRFIFSDIQAIVIAEGPDRTIWQGLAGLVSFSWGFWAFEAASAFGKAFFAVTGFIAIAFVIRDVVRGPRCRCVLQTAVSRERLLPVSRIRVAGRFLAAITPAIQEVQGSVPAEEVANAQTFAGSPAQPPEIPRSRSFMAEVFFGLLLLDSTLVWVALRSSVGVALGLLPTVYLAEFILGVLALIHARSRMGIASVLVLAAFLCVVIDPFTLSGAAGWQGLMNGVREGGSNQPRSDLLIQAPMNTILLSAGWRVTVGLYGLGTCYLERRKEKRQ